MISSFVRAFISAFKARCELVPADELNRRHRVQEDHQQPLPDVSTVSECSNQGRESCEDRVNHSENRHRNPEAGHGDMIYSRWVST